jgi:NAD(P)H-dependent FMN reductase
MQIAILSASTRINRKSHRVALHLTQMIEQTTSHSVDLLDLAAYQFPIMEEVLSKQTNQIAGLIDFSKRIKDADACIFLSPEYNGSYTAALKNAVDALEENEFKRKVIGVVSVTTGSMGGPRAALAMQQLALGVGAYAIPNMLLAGLVDKRFDEDGMLIEPTFEKSIRTFMDAFLWLSEAVVEKKNAVLTPV